MRVPVSVIVLTYNESKNIARTLSALKRFDDVTVVDSNSTDDTVDKAKSFGADVMSFSWNGVYPKKKQWALENVQAKYEWILLLDADEHPTPELIEEIASTVAAPAAREFGAYEIKLRYWFAGRPLQHGHTVVKRSLLRRGAAQFPVFDDLRAAGIGEVEGHYQPQVVGRLGLLRHRLVHQDLDPIESWFARHNRYSTWEARLRSDRTLRSGVARTRSRNGQLFDRVPFKPIAFFVYAFIVKRGFLDGRVGADYAVALAFYYWQTDMKTRVLGRSPDTPS